jgi:hypothetical protein
VDRKKAVGYDRDQAEEIETMPAYIWVEVYDEAFPVQINVIVPDIETARQLGQAELRAFHTESNAWLTEEQEAAAAERNAQLSRVATVEPEVREVPCAFSIPGRN